jgi:hypothetical protein
MPLKRLLGTLDCRQGDMPLSSNARLRAVELPSSWFTSVLNLSTKTRRIGVRTRRHYLIDAAFATLLTGSDLP